MNQTSMNHFRLTVFMFLCWAMSMLPLQAQQRESGGGDKYSMAGRIVDGETGKSLEYATVVLLRLSDSSVVTGTVSDSKGAFTLEAGTGQYLLRVQFLGYAPQFVEGIEVSAERPFFRVGQVSLATVTATLDEVEIRAEKSKMTFELDKKVFNVGQDLTTMGGTAADLLDNIPSVTVDIDGNVSLRGSEGVRILVNGKPSGLTGANALQQLQPNMIDRVEIITNPSARYEAEGTAGIINIILKKEKQNGWNGSFDATLGTPANHNAAINLNHRREKLNFFGSLGFRYRDTPRTGIENRETYDAATDSWSYLDQDYAGQRGGYSGSLRLGADYSFNQYNILTGSVLYRASEDFSNSDIDYFFYNSNRVLQQINRRNNDEIENEYSFDYNLSFERTFARKGQKFTADLVYTSGGETEDMDAVEQSFDASDVSLGKADLLQHILNDENENEWMLKADYVHPIGKDGKFEAGYRGSIRNIDNAYAVDEFDDALLAWFTRTDISNDFVYDENIQSLYSSYGNKAGKFSYQMGLRAEISHIETKLVQTKSENDKRYTNLFPSVFLNYEIATGNAVQVNYSRRIRRPRFHDLNPFFSYSNPLSFRSGNPNLNPEFTHSMELSYLKYVEKGSLSSSVYYRHTTGVIQRITTLTDSLSPEGERISLQRPENLATRDDMGVELSVNLEPAKWISLTANVNVFRGVINGDNLGFAESTEFLGYTGSLNSRLKITPTLDAQVMINYRGPEKSPQGARKSMLFTDVGLSKDIWKNKATITFRASDIFNSMRYRYESFGEDFYIYREGNWRSRRQVYLGFSYRLNQKKRRQRPERVNMGGE